MALARFYGSSNSYTTNQEVGMDTTFATDKGIQVEMYFTHAALECLIIISTQRLLYFPLRIFLFIQ